MARGRLLLVGVCALALTAPAAHAAPGPCPGVGPATTLIREGGGQLESMVFAASGRLVYSDLGRNRLRVLASPGAAPSTLARVPFPGGMAALPDGDLVAASGNSLGAILPSQVRVARVDAATGAVTTHARGLVGANGLAMAPDGTVFTSDPLTARIDRVAPDGKVTPRWWARGSANGLAVSADGKTLFASLSLQARIVAIDIATGATRTVARAPADRFWAFLDGLAASDDGALYVAAYLAGEVWRVSPGGAICVLARMATPAAPVVGEAGAGFSPTSLYVATHGGRVIEIPGAVAPAGSAS